MDKDEALQSDKLEGKKTAYFFHSYGRAKSRYDLILGKLEQRRICDAISKGDDYIPVEMIKDWGGSRQMYRVGYMGTPLRLIYDKEVESIVTFLPLDEKPTYRCNICRDKGWFTKRITENKFNVCKCGKGKALDGFISLAKLDAFKAGLERSASLKEGEVSRLLLYASK